MYCFVAILPPRNNAACDFTEGFLSYEQCRKRAALLSEEPLTPCSKLNISAALEKNQVHCQAIGTDAFQELWMLTKQSSAYGEVGHWSAQERLQPRLACIGASQGT